jgi:hypothetical protein
MDFHGFVLFTLTGSSGSSKVTSKGYTSSKASGLSKSSPSSSLQRLPNISSALPSTSSSTSSSLSGGRKDSPSASSSYTGGTSKSSTKARIDKT